MDTSERLAALEEAVQRHEALIGRLMAYARLHPTGRVLLRALGL